MIVKEANENNRISKLFRDLYDGNPWIDINIVSVLSDLNESEAARKIFPDWNSSWEIVNHMIEWRKTVLKRLEGEAIESPKHNYFLPVKDTTAEAWQITLEQLKSSQLLWLEYIGNIKVRTLIKTLLRME